jgi:hypothetical protein
MLPQEITDLASRMLPLIAQSTDHYNYHGSGLKSKEWDALKTRLLADGLATSLTGELLQLTPEGHEVVSKGPKGYIKFRKKRDSEKNDSLLTNLYSRYGAIATVGATIISLAALLIPLFKSDNTDTKIKELEQKQVLLRVELDSLHRHLGLLSQKQDSLILVSLKLVQRVNSKSSVPHAISPSSARRPTQGQAAPAKRP